MSENAYSGSYLSLVKALKFNNTYKLEGLEFNIWFEAFSNKHSFSS
jgi:hypothetical protein